MNTKEELNALKEEELEETNGGVNIWDIAVKLKETQNVKTILDNKNPDTENK